MVDLRALHQSKSLDDATRTLRDALTALGVRDVVYGYMLEPGSFFRRDVCLSVTLTDELMKVYEASGGLSTDPVAEKVPTTKAWFSIDLEDLAADKGAKRLAQYQYVNAMRRAGYRSIWVFPTQERDPVGFGTVTLFQDEHADAPRIDPVVIAPYAYEFHEIVKSRGLLAELFDLSAMETKTLRRIAAGKSAVDIADAEGVSPRAVELRLQRVRKKLRASNTVEAVFKATVYGILRDE